MNCETLRSSWMHADGTPEAQEAREHATTCAQCAEFLREQQRLSSLLAMLRAQNGAGKPDAAADAHGATQLEARLLAAFRQVHESDMAGPSSSIDSVPAARTLHPANLAQWGALAAMVTLAFGVTWGIQQVLRLPNLTPPPRISLLPQPPKDWMILSAAARHEGSISIPDRSPERRAIRRPNAARTLYVDELDFADNSANSEEPLAAAAPPKNPLTTSHSLSGYGGFIELIPGTPGFLDDGPLIMRVRMPYAAVGYLGAPAVRPAYGSSPEWRDFVQADLLVGSDGTARAIRFVQ